ncbi:MAG: hypothetical protein ABWX74_06305, partial [Aeromicrobium sp.]
MTMHLGTSGGRRPTQALLGLLVVVAMVLAAGSPASAATKRSVSLKATPASVVAGAKVTLSGTVSKSPKGTKVRIEKLTGRTWKAFKNTRTTSAKGAFKLAVKTSSAGTTSYRAVAPKTTKLKVATSKPRTVKVRAAAPAPVTPVPPVTAPPVTDPPTPGTPGVGSTVKLSQAANGTGTDNYSELPVISADGRYVAFASAATNLVAGDTNRVADVFVTDRTTGTTIKVSQGVGGVGADGGSGDPSISADGQYIAYSSDAGNIVAGDGDHIQQDLYLWDRQTGLTTKITQASAGTAGASFGRVSADGHYVVYSSRAVGGDLNGVGDLYSWDRLTGISTKISLAVDGGDADGGSGSADISADNRYIVFESDATNLVAGDTNGKSDIFSWDRQTGLTIKVTSAVGGGASNGYASGAAISADGRFVAFNSSASNLVAGDVSSFNAVYVWDRQTATTTKVSLPAGVADPGGSSGAGISSDGRYVVYQSWAPNVVAGDTNEARDIFVWDRQAGARTKVSQAADGGQTNGDAYDPTISDDGRFVTY